MLLHEKYIQNEPNFKESGFSEGESFEIYVF